jgi:hypothetical protein
MRQRRNVDPMKCEAASSRCLFGDVFAGARMPAPLLLGLLLTGP